MCPAIVSTWGRDGQLFVIFSLSPVAVSEVFVKVNWLNILLVCQVVNRKSFNLCTKLFLRYLKSTFCLLSEFFTICWISVQWIILTALWSLMYQILQVRNVNLVGGFTELNNCFAEHKCRHTFPLLSCYKDTVPCTAPGLALSVEHWIANREVALILWSNIFFLKFVIVFYIFPAPASDCFSFLKFINLSPEQLSAMMLKGLVFRWACYLHF